MALCLNGDCLELMKDLPDKSVDLFLCDLPYGCLTQKAGCIPFERNKSGPCNAGCPWDIKIDLVAFWIQVKRLCKNDKTPVLMFCNTKFGFDLYNSNPDWFRYDLVWNKNHGVNFLDANRMPMKSHEMIYVFSKKSCNYNRIDVEIEGKGAYVCETYGDTKIYGKKKHVKTINTDGKRCVLSVITPFGNGCGRIIDKRHPTAKNLPLLKWLIERYSNENDMVLDPTAGSFNSGRACLSLNRQYIGMEMNKDFYDNNKLYLATDLVNGF
jgi:site-specific DNA-methyltransferase (adenine-specific)